MNFEDKIHKFVIEYDSEHMWEVCAYERFIRDHIAQGNKIPARVLKKYISFFRYTHDREDRELRDWLRQAQIKVIERFSNDKEYTFSQIRLKEIAYDFMDSDTLSEFMDADVQEQKELRENGKKKKRKVQYSFDKMIDSVFDDLFYTIKAHPQLRKQRDELTKVVYTDVINYLSNLTGATKTDFGKYQIYTVVAFIVTQLEFRFTDKKNPNNAALFQSIRYTIETKLPKIQDPRDV